MGGERKLGELDHERRATISSHSDSETGRRDTRRLGWTISGLRFIGREEGPLRIVTKSVSYGVMFGSAYGLTRLHIRRGHRTQRRTRNFGRSPRNRDLRLICAGHQNEAGHSANHDEAE